MEKSTFIKIIATFLLVSAMILLLIASEKRSSAVMQQKYCFYEQSDGSLGHYLCDESGTGGYIPTSGQGGSNQGSI